MADGISVTAPASPAQPHSSVFEDLTPHEEQAGSRPQIFNMDVNYANENKWYAYLPIEDCLGKKFKNLNLHLTAFSIPQLMQSSITASFKGYEKEMPGKVLIPSTKEVRLEYIVDADWSNYRALYAFLSNINGTINPISEDEKTGILPTEYLPIRVYLLSPYKKKIIQFVFENCWIKIFDELSLNVNSAEIVKHAFTCVFDQYRIDDVVHY